ncbi:complex I subunit 5 family protein [Colwellia hornerae]|uniref:Oxidoreductase n=1 Tax=Colwellia hornerae TaxID=89402 RepID=A0A5C6Q412_9GAMM|nr:proton-conducting transporter membrane subunit [Colwellia hornerae]TWX52172.1 oxidoreductase [Colwellia hornerae]TWX57521.1 oxidoreductase [Colwellia hornerae]TWX63377.1 oxidoreductase [Colwellia hornerae]
MKRVAMILKVEVNLINNFITIFSIPTLMILPMVIAIICFVAGNTRLSRLISVISSITLVVICALQAGYVLQQAAPIELIIGGWQPPLGIRLSINEFSAIMLLMTSTIGLAITFYSTQYFDDDEKEIRFWPLWWFLITALNGVFISSDIFNTYIMLELLGLSAVSLIAIQGTQQALQASFQYLLVGLFGSLMYLLGVAIIYRTYGVLDNQLVANLVESNTSMQLALALITLGMMMKCALFPLHFWLPSAHSNASAPVSAMLSALVVKAAFFILFTFWFKILAPVVTFTAVTIMGIFGAMAVIYGSYRAFTSPRLKQLIAYSTVAQIGYLFLAFPLMFTTPDLARTAVIYFIVAHGCAKAAMFLAAGVIQKAMGHDQLSQLQGIASQLPISIFVFAVTSASLIGLPPSGGFIAKWLLLNNAVEAQQWWWVLTLFIGGLLASAYLFRVLNLAFTTPTQENSLTVLAISESKLLGAVGLSIITIIIGLNAMWLTNLITGSY